MSNTELIRIEVIESQIPSIIQQQFGELQKLKENVEISTQKAEDAHKSAIRAKNTSTGLFKKKEAIENLQDATVDLADAQISAAEAQELSFEYQQKLGEISKYLFGLGVSNIAANRSVARELEMRLKGASEEELDEFARQEIMGVVRQLKAQEDIMKKQAELSERVKAHDTILDAQEVKNTEYTRLIEERVEHERQQDELLKQHSEKDKEHDVLLEKSQLKDDEQDRMIAEGEEKDKVQDKELARQAKKDIEHDRKIAAGEEKDKSQDEEISRQAKKGLEHDRKIAAGEEKDKSQDEEISRQAKKGLEHDRKIVAGEEKNKSQDEEISRQAEKDKEHDEQISNLTRTTVVQGEKIASLEQLCVELQELIDANNNKFLDAETELTTKIDSRFSRGAFIASMAIGILALAAAIAGFFI